MPFIGSIEGNFSPIGRSRKPFNLATGGTVTDVANYNGTGQLWRVHTFTGSGTFTAINSSNPFSLLVVGGGAAGCAGICGTGQASCAGSGGGSGGYYLSSDSIIPVASHSVSIGSGGSASGGAGGSTSFGSIQTCTGGSSHGGQVGGTAGSPNGINGGYNSDGNMTYKTSNITGTSTNYAAGGSGYYGSNITYYGSGGKAAQRSGGDYPDGSGFNGTAGIVVVAYQIG